MKKRMAAWGTQMMGTRNGWAAWSLVLGLVWGCSTNGTDGTPSGDVVDAAVPGIPPLINEFVTRNQTGLTDEDGSTSDWIELVSQDTVPFDLGGYHLTDSKASPKRWTFPEGTVIQPGAFLVVFASGKNRIVAGKPLHTNFSLSSGSPQGSCSGQSGGYLALTDRDGVPVGPVFDPYPAQSADVAYGLRSPVPTADRSYFQKPTPAAPNNLGSAPADRVVIEPSSRTFAVFTPLQVTLSTASPTAVIRYTTNRARPIAVPGSVGPFAADAMTDTCTQTAHGLQNGDPVRVSGPAPLTSGNTYFAVVLSPDTFKLAVEPGGPPIDLTASGTFEVRRDAANGTAATSDIITTTYPHTFFAGDSVTVSTSGTLPAPLTAGTTYYVDVLSSTTLRLSTSPTLVPAVDITTTGSGSLTVSRTPSPTYSKPLSVSVTTRVRARAFETGRPDGPLVGAMYFALDAAAQTANSNLPLVLTHSFNTAILNNNVPIDSYIMFFEPKAPDNLAKMTNLPDLVAPCTLERHGSSTGGEAKFSMVVELQDENGIDQNCSPFGMPAESDWMLNAPYRYDRSMMHNDLLYRLSNNAGRWAVHTKLVEHFHNEQSAPDTIEGSFTGVDYFGVYSFMEKIKRGPSRVNVEGLSIGDSTTPTIAGGYIFKADRLDPGEVGIVPLSGQSFGGMGGNVMPWVYPRELSPDPFKVVNLAQSNWLRGHLGEAWSVLGSASYADPVNGYAKYWDVAALIDNHILNAASKNADAFRLSAFWHKPRLGKITAGPVWDYDRAMGSTDGRDFDYGTWTGVAGFFNYAWYVQMFADPNFRQAWIDRLHELRQGPMSTQAIHAHIDEFAGLLNPGDGAGTPAKRSAVRWPVSAPRTTANNTAITNNLFDGTYPGEVAWLKYWWEKRLAFMDGELTRPAVANIPSGKVAIGTTITLSSPSQSLPGVKLYYTTDGSDPRPPAPGPVLSAKAIEYTGPITISGPTQLVVRTYNPTPATVAVTTNWSAKTVLDYTQ